MRARDGQWVGFNLDSNGHRIYWPDTKAVGVEWSVIFEKCDMAVPYNVPLEGESGNAQNASAQPHAQQQQCADTAQHSTEMASQHIETETIGHSPDPLGTTFETPPPPPRCSTRQRFESDYTRRLCTGEGTRDGHIMLDHMRQLCDAVTNQFSNLWAIIHPPLSTEQGVRHVRHVRRCAPGSIKVL